MPILPNEACAQSVPHNAPVVEQRATETRGQAQLNEGGVQGVCSAPTGLPQLARAKEEEQTGRPEERGICFSAHLASFLKKIFKLESPVADAPDEAELRTARAVKRHRSPAGMDITYPISATAKRIGECTAKGMRHRIREEDSTSRVICFAVPLCEARMGFGVAFAVTFCFAESDSEPSVLRRTRQLMTL
ncbi:hypothetical protein ERJ75_000685300 [Trypanosoma vivax]|nr:hypothetical protein ERJ75_000685300 [Trypanosoma vivax]